jgi:hypothetical protein
MTDWSGMETMVATNSDRSKLIAEDAAMNQENDGLLYTDCAFGEE